MSYKIEKQKIVKKFKDFVDSKSSKEDDFGNNSKKKQVGPLDRYEILLQFRYLYEWLLNNIKLDIRRSYIHDDAVFKKTYSKLQNHINNKIRTNSQGNIYLSVNNDKVKLFGTPKEQDHYITANKNNLVNLFRQIVDEIISLLNDELPEDPNRVMLRDHIKLRQDEWVDSIKDKVTADKIAENILMHIPEDILVSIHSCGRFDEFSAIFKEVYNSLLEAANEYEKEAIVEIINENNIDQIISDVRNSCAMSELIIKESEDEV